MREFPPDCFFKFTVQRKVLHSMLIRCSTAHVLALGCQNYSQKTAIKHRNVYGCQYFFVDVHSSDNNLRFKKTSEVFEELSCSLSKLLKWVRVRFKRSQCSKPAVFIIAK